MDFRGRTERVNAQVGFDGYPSRYQSGTRMVVREASGRVFSRQFGWYRRSSALVPYGAGAFLSPRMNEQAQKSVNGMTFHHTQKHFLEE